MNINTISDWVLIHGPHVRRRLRLLMLLDAADYAVISPITKTRIHALAFLADVLCPLFELSTLTRCILKRHAGPYFPDLQWELDRLVGLGLVKITELKPFIRDSHVYIDARFIIKRETAMPLLSVVYKDNDFAKLREYFRELAGALGSIPEDDLDKATRSDVTWETGHGGTVIDYDGWESRNYSQLSAERIEELVKTEIGQSGLNIKLSPEGKLNLYIRYLRRVANA